VPQKALASIACQDTYYLPFKLEHNASLEVGEVGVEFYLTNTISDDFGSLIYVWQTYSTFFS